MKILIPWILFFNFTYAQTTVFGKWKTIDDNTGKEKSIVEISQRGGKVYGKIIRIFPEPGKNPDPICNKCPEDDARHNKKVVGMDIIKDMVKSDDDYDEGTILDPEVGKIYKCKIWLDGKDLKVRGYLGPFYRTQTWKRL